MPRIPEGPTWFQNLSGSIEMVENSLLEEMLGKIPHMQTALSKDISSKFLNFMAKFLNLYCLKIIFSECIKLIFRTSSVTFIKL